MAQLVARDVWDVDAAGSNPVTPTISSVHNTSELRTLDFLPMLMSNKAKGDVDFISDL